MERNFRGGSPQRKYSGKEREENEHEEVPCNHDGAVHDAVRVCRGGNRESCCQHGRQPCCQPRCGYGGPAIAAVLNGGSEVYVPSDKTNKTLQDALNDEFTEGAGYDSFAVLDVDGDGKLDVVLNVTVNGEVLGYLVLTSADEVICAYGFYYRAMIGLKEDGSFSFSSSAVESGVATFYKDENRDAQYNELAESKLDENENVVYFVNGEAADEDAFTAVINAQNEKADVTFVPATAENLALYLTIE